jgi:hypothetical protein
LWPSLEKVLEDLIYPHIRRHHFLQLVSKPSLAHLKRFSFTAKRADGFRERGWIPIGHHTSTVLTSYYSARMACYLEVVDLGVWRVTRDGMKPPKNLEKPTTSEEKEIHLANEI